MNLDRIDWPDDPPPRPWQTVLACLAALAAAFALGFAVAASIVA